MATKKFSLKDSPIFKSTTVPKPEGPEKATPSSEAIPPEPGKEKEEDKALPPERVKEEDKAVGIPPSVYSAMSIGKTLGLSRRAIGLDIAADQVTIVELGHTPTGARLDKFGLAPIPRQPEEEKEIIKAIKNVLQTSGINPKDVIVSIPGNLINHVLLSFPPMPKKELNNALQREVKQNTTTSPEDTIASYLPLGEISRKGIQKQNVLLIMVSKTEVGRYLSLLKESGIFPAAISTTQIAFYNLWQKIGREERDKAVALVEIKGSTVTVNICRGTQFYLCRTIKVPDRENMEVFLSQVRVELDRSFLYYKQQFRGETVEKILLSGDSQDIKTITKILSENLRMEVKEFNPLESVSVRKGLLPDLPPSPALLTTAIGLAIEGNKRKRERVNLLPEEIQERTQRITKRIFVGVAGSILATVLLLAYWGLETTSQSYRQLLADQKERLLQIKPIITKYETVKKKEQALQGGIRLVERLVEETPRLSPILQDLSNIVPKEVFFREISFGKGTSRDTKSWNLTIRGELIKGTSGWRGPLTTLLANLKKSSFLREVVLEPIQEVESSETEKQLKTMPFTIKCLLN